MGNDEVHFNGMLDRVRAIVASAGAFDPKPTEDRHEGR
jgi:hypothetical protein